MNVRILLIAMLLIPGFAGATGTLVSLVPLESTLGAAQCPDNQYGLETQSIGLRTVVCNLRKVVDVTEVETRLGVSVFQEGSKKDPFDFKNTIDFNRYNPELFARLRELHKSEYGEAVISSAYDRYFQHIFRSYYVVGKAIRNNREFSETYLALYRAAISKGESINPDELQKCKNISVYYANEYGSESTAYKQGMHYSNVAYFWFRREIDGSSEELFKLISQLVATHDPDYYSQIEAKNPMLEKECDEEIVCAS